MGHEVGVQKTMVWKHEGDCTVRRAQTSPFSRADLGHWGAIIIGEDAHFGLGRTFLSKTYPVTWQKKITPRLDFSPVRTGMVIQLHGNVSRNSQEDLFYRVVAIDDEAVEVLELTGTEVLREMRSGGQEGSL